MPCGCGITAQKLNSCGPARSIFVTFEFSQPFRAMKSWSTLPLAVVLMMTSVQAQSPALESWHAHTVQEAVAYTALFAVLGFALAFLGYRLFDKLTPGDLHREIIEKHNVAAAILAAAVVLGICIIIAAAMVG